MHEVTALSLATRLITGLGKAGVIFNMDGKLKLWLLSILMKLD